MKNLKDLLNAVVEPIKLGDAAGFSNFLTEESDFEETRIITEEDDPFASNDAGGDTASDPFGGGDAGGDATGNANADPFGNNMSNDAGGNGEGSSNNDNEDNDEDDKEKDPDANPALTDGSHDPDPEFNQGENDENDVTLSKSPSIHSSLNLTEVMKVVATVIQTLSEDQLVEIEKVKNDVELIFNGFLLNDEDLEFENVENAIFLIEKIAEKLNIKAKSYLIRKMKEPLIKKRDGIKQDIATKKGELNTTRDILTKLDTKL